MAGQSNIRALLKTAFVFIIFLTPVPASANDVKALLANGESKSGNISGPGFDLYSFDAKEGSSFLVNVSDKDNQNDPNFVMNVEIIPPGSNLPAMGLGQPGHIRLTQIAKSAGTYTAKISQMNQTSGGNYLIQVIVLPGVKGKMLKFGETYKGVTDGTGSSIFNFNGTPGVTARVAIKSTGGKNYMPIYMIYSPTGNPLSGGSVSTDGDTAEIPMDSYDPYTIMVDVDDGSVSNGSYELTVMRSDGKPVEPPPPSPEALRNRVLSASPPESRTIQPYHVPFYVDGLLVTLNPDLSASKDRKGAEQGNIGAMINLGDSEFKITPTDVKWWLKAAVEHAGDAKDRLVMACARGYVKEKICETEQASSWYRLASDQGNIDVPVSLTSLYKGNGTPKDDAEIIALSRGYAEQGNVGPQYLLGVAYERGRGVVQDYAEAEKWYRKAVDQGFGPAEYSLGNLYRYGHGTRKTDDAGPDFEAFRWYKKAYEHGVPAATIRVANMYLFGYGESQDLPKALDLYRKAAEQGIAVAQFNLAGLNTAGLGGEPDLGETAKWYRKAADQGLIAAQYFLGQLYEEGSGVRQDYTEAAALYRKAAEAGYPQAQYYLGRLYKAGLGVAKDDAQAQAWLKKAVDAGIVEAQAELAEMQGPEGQTEALKIWEGRAAQGDRDSLHKFIAAYRAGAVPQDPEYALGILRGGASSGDPEAYAAIGDFFANGKYWPQSDYEAYFWYRLTVEEAPNGHLSPEEKDRLLKYVSDLADKIKKGLSKEQLAATNWRIDDRHPKPSDQNKKEAADLYIKGDAAETQGQYITAQQYYMAADGDDLATAAYDLGSFYEYGRGLARDMDRSVYYFKKAVRNGSVGAASRIGEMYLYGIGVSPDMKEAEKWFEIDASRGDIGARNKLGWLYLYGQKDDRKAISLYERWAALSSAESADVLGMIHLYGEGQLKDPQKALKWYRLAADHGEITGRIQAAWILLNYDPHDYNLAFNYLRHNVNPVTINNTAYLLEHALITDKNLTAGLDNATAFQLYQKAADMCYGRAMYHIGRLYESGVNDPTISEQPIPEDHDKALKWMKMAAHYGSAAARDWLNGKDKSDKNPKANINPEMTLPVTACQQPGGGK